MHLIIWRPVRFMFDPTAAGATSGSYGEDKHPSGGVLQVTLTLLRWEFTLGLYPLLLVTPRLSRDLFERASIPSITKSRNVPVSQKQKHKTNSWTIASTVITALMCGFRKHNESWRTNRPGPNFQKSARNWDFSVSVILQRAVRPIQLCS